MQERRSRCSLARLLVGLRSRLQMALTKQAESEETDRQSSGVDEKAENRRINWTAAFFASVGLAGRMAGRFGWSQAGRDFVSY